MNEMHLGQAIEGLLGSLTPTARRKVLMALARELRRRRQKNLLDQVAPDGAAFTPRKRLRDREGRLRGKMFPRLRLARNLRVRSTSDAAIVEFRPMVSRVARLHHDGGRDRVSRHGPYANYPARRLLGFAQDDERLIMDALIRLLAG